MLFVSMLRLFNVVVVVVVVDYNYSLIFIMILLREVYNMIKIIWFF